MGELKATWVPHDTRDKIVVFILYWSSRTKMPSRQPIGLRYDPCKNDSLLSSKQREVENLFYYLETHFIQDSRFVSFEDFLSRLKQFELEVNNSVHSVTRKKPSELFDLESKVLLPLPFDPITAQVKRDMKEYRL